MRIRLTRRGVGTSGLRAREDAGSALRATRSSDFDKKFTTRGKCLSANFRAATLALVTPQDRNTRCEQLVNRYRSFFALRITIPAGSGAQRHRRFSKPLVAYAAMIAKHFHHLTEVFYAPTCLPKLVSPHRFLPAAPL